MKKLVVKTVAITVAAIIVLSAAVYLTLALCLPKTLANGWKNMGNYSLAAKYYEKQYNKSEDVEDLAVLCIYLDVKTDSARAEKYLKLLTGRDDFKNYCENEDNNGGYNMTSYEYYYGKFAVSTYYEKGIDAAVKVASEAVSAGYSEHNAFYILLIDVETLTESDGGKLSAAITDIKSGLTGETEIDFADRDIALANSVR